MKDDKLSIDQAYKELQAIVDEFEHGDIDLEKSIPKFRKGLELAAYLQDKLGKLKVEVEEIKANILSETAPVVDDNSITKEPEPLPF